MAVRPSAPAVLGGGGGLTSGARSPQRVASAYASGRGRRYEVVHTPIRTLQLQLGALGSSRSRAPGRSVDYGPDRLHDTAAGPHTLRPWPRSVPEPGGMCGVGRGGPTPRVV